MTSIKLLNSVHSIMHVHICCCYTIVATVNRAAPSSMLAMGQCPQQCCAPDSIQQHSPMQQCSAVPQDDVEDQF
jgi:hypothetical protein